MKLSLLTLQHYCLIAITLISTFTPMFANVLPAGVIHGIVQWAGPPIAVLSTLLAALSDTTAGKAALAQVAAAAAVPTVKP
jgi:hypothetical protein